MASYDTDATMSGIYHFRVNLLLVPHFMIGLGLKTEVIVLFVYMASTVVYDEP